MSVEWDIANKLRTAIDIAYAKDELYKLYPFSGFPDNCCGHTCDLLGYLLALENIDSYQVNGIHKCDPQWHHVWVVTAGGVIIDITEDQFVKKNALKVNEVERVRVGKEGPAQKLFCVGRKSQCHTNFTDPNQYTDFGGQPNARQKRLIEVFNVIKKYL